MTTWKGKSLLSYVGILIYSNTCAKFWAKFEETEEDVAAHCNSEEKL